jgi:hypothetical protein
MPARCASSTRARAENGVCEGDHRRGEVPRGNGGGHADWLFNDDQTLVRLVAWDHIAIHALGFFGEPLNKGGCIGNLALGFGQWLALFQGHQAAEVVLVLHQQFEPAAQLARAFLGGQGTPGRQGTVGGFDGATGFRSAHLRHAANDFAGGRVVDLDGLATVGVQPGTVDISLLTEQLGVFQLHGSLLNSDTLASVRVIECTAWRYTWALSVGSGCKSAGGVRAA